MCWIEPIVVIVMNYTLPICKWWKSH